MRLTSEDVERIGRRAEEIYDSKVAPLVQHEASERIVVIDVESQDFEVGDTYLQAAHVLESRHPGKYESFYGMRIGKLPVYVIGGSSLSWRKS